MHAALKKVAPLAVLALAAATLAGCVVAPAQPYYGDDAYYAQPSPVYVAPRYYYGSRYHYWHHNRWHGNRWHGNGDWD